MDSGLGSSGKTVSTRTSLTELANSAVDAVNAVERPLRSRSRAKKNVARVNKSNKSHFKKGSAHPRAKSRYSRPLDRFVRVAETLEEEPADQRPRLELSSPRLIDQRIKANEPSSSALSSDSAPIQHPLPTPAASPDHASKLRRSPASTPSASPKKKRRVRRYRKCGACKTTRELDFFSSKEADCRYCVDGIGFGDIEYRWCLKGCHTVPASDFTGSKNSCLNHPYKPFVAAADEVTLDEFKQRAAQRPLDGEALSASQWKLVCNFNKKLDAVVRQVCDICNEERFDAGVEDYRGQATCKRCRHDFEFLRRDLEKPFVGLFSADNAMDPGEMPAHLPVLTMVEEMLIARVHPVMCFSRIKSVQYKYSGHIVNFMQNSPKIVSRLPSLPSELQILHLKPPSTGLKNSALQREYDRIFNVRRHAVEQWLWYLVVHHPEYKNLSIHQHRLQQLPVNGSILPGIERIDFAAAEKVRPPQSPRSGMSWSLFL